MRAGTGAPYAVETTKTDRDHLLDGTLAQSAMISSLVPNPDAVDSVVPL